MTQIAAAFEELLHIGIEKRLVQLGIKGEKGNARACVISRYLQMYCGDPYAGIGLAVATAGPDYHPQDVPLMVQEFITAFDNGKYPHLVEIDS